VSWAIWITGPSSRDTSAVARAASDMVAVTGMQAALLEVDRMRAAVTPHATGTATEHEILNRSLVFAARALTEVGVPVIIDAAGGRRAWRDLARSAIKSLAEVQLAGPSALAQAREAARDGGAERNVDVPYEWALSPELTIDATAENPATAGARVAALASAFPRAGRRSSSPGGSVVWLTGPPGSGKTTLACCLAERLASAGVSVTMLDWAALRAFVFAASWVDEHDEETAHRALAWTAKLLAEAGLVVVIDATAPRRAWRARAREIVGDLLEVQLMCPADVCLDRERAARWSPYGGVATATPDLAVEYEYSTNPDLLLDTETRSAWTAAEDLVRFARRRLARASTP
jgi:adenylylsulfate kinase-like enzyme